MRAFVLFLGLVFMLGCGVAIAAWPSRSETLTQAQFSAQQLRESYMRVHAGITPVSQLANLGFDPANATKLSYLGVMEQLMPQDSFSFDALDPAVQSCFEARDRCTAYIFSPSRRSAARVILLIQGGRVAYKQAFGLSGLASDARPIQFRASSSNL